MALKFDNDYETKDNDQGDENDELDSKSPAKSTVNPNVATISFTPTSIEPPSKPASNISTTKMAGKVKAFISSATTYLGTTPFGPQKLRQRL